MQKPKAAPGGNEGVSMVTVTVARGRTVQIKAKAFGPGEQVEVSAEDAEFLRGRGFVLLEDGAQPVSPLPPTLGQHPDAAPLVIRSTPGDTSNPANIGLQQRFER